MADGEAEGDGVGVDESMGVEGEGRMAAGENIPVTRSHTSFVEE